MRMNLCYVCTHFPFSLYPINAFWSPQNDYCFIERMCLKLPHNDLIILNLKSLVTSFYFIRNLMRSHLIRKCSIFSLHSLSSPSSLLLLLLCCCSCEEKRKIARRAQKFKNLITKLLMEQNLIIRNAVKLISNDCVNIIHRKFVTFEATSPLGKMMMIIITHDKIGHKIINGCFSWSVCDTNIKSHCPFCV